MLSDLYLNFSYLSTIIVASVILQFELISLSRLGVVNFHSLQMNLVMSIRFIFGDD